MDEGAGFEGLLVWQRARVLSREIMPVVQSAARQRDFVMSQQLSASALSVMANIAEGHLRRNRPEFAQFLRIAAGSNGELRACLYAALDRGYVAPSVFERLRDETNQVGRMLEALRRAVCRQQPRRA